MWKRCGSWWCRSHTFCPPWSCWNRYGTGTVLGDVYYESIAITVPNVVGNDGMVKMFRNFRRCRWWMMGFLEGKQNRWFELVKRWARLIKDSFITSVFFLSGWTFLQPIYICCELAHFGIQQILLKQLKELNIIPLNEPKPSSNFQLYPLRSNVI